MDFKIRYIVLFLSLILVSILISCNEDPLGLEDNVNITTIEKNDDGDDGDTSDIIKTKFQADSINVQFSEYIVKITHGDTVGQRWTSMITDARAILDTLNGFTFENLMIMSQRRPDDSIQTFRNEYIVGFALQLDSFKISNEYSFTQNTKHYKSQLNIWLKKERTIATVFGNYPFEIHFKKVLQNEDYIIYEGFFILEVPVNRMMNKYDYFFRGDLYLRFKLE